MPVFLHFLDRLQDHYLWLLGLLFMIEPTLDYNIERYKEWADKFVSRRVRTRIAITMSAAALFCASYLAFRDEYDAAELAKKSAQQITGERDEARRQRDTNVSPSLDRMSGDLLAARGQIDAQAKQIKQQETEMATQKGEINEARNDLTGVTARYARRHVLAEQTKTIQQVAKVPEGEAYSIAVFQPSDCFDCNEYSAEFIEALAAPSVGWKITLFTTMHGGINPHFHGVAIIIKDMNNPPKAALALAGALRSANIQFTAGAAEGFNVADNGIGLLIGPKEEK